MAIVPRYHGFKFHSENEQLVEFEDELDFNVIGDDVSGAKVVSVGATGSFGEFGDVLEVWLDLHNVKYYLEADQELEFIEAKECLINI